ncbi:hypothetical protein [Arthrobacter sp. CG_A4]|uniref:hypothetical protein n=1 Tax=Arthrobacter sp. CG_A4 TaxID=3071706 RepID=UPI002E063B57|nr:hypothetical protein [Arthrobacter sp. CG_A4]
MQTKWRTLPYLLLLTTALIFLAIGIWAGFEPWVTAILVAVPIVVMLVLSALAMRSHDTKDKDSQVVSRNAVSEGETVVEVPLAELPAAVERALASNRRFRLRNVSRQGAEIRASWTLKTWGEDISLTFEDVDGRFSRVRGVCVPVYGPTIIDYGQGASDLSHIFREIKREAGPMKATDSGGA